jgi:hypothetical protein
LTNRRRFESQIARQTVVEENIQFIDRQVSRAIEARLTGASQVESPGPALPNTIPPELVEKYHIAEDSTNHVSISDFLRRNSNDPALKVTYYILSLNFVSQS